MGINVEHITERGEIISLVTDEYFVFSRLIEELSADSTKYPYLSIIDQYGDTYFNQKQLPILLAEMKKLLAELIEIDTIKIVTEIIGLTESTSGRVHLYLKFSGD